MKRRPNRSQAPAGVVETRTSTKAIGFALIPMMGIVGSILVLPVITARFGATAWVAVAVGQSIGAALSSVAELGWALNGPQRVARMSADHTYRVTILSFQTKFLVFPPLAVISIVASFLLAPAYRFESALAAVSTLAIAFSLSWVFLGRSKPWSIVNLDSLPRLVGLIAAAAILYAGGPLWVFPVVGLLVPSVVSPWISLIRIRSWSALRSKPKAPFRQVLWTLRSQVHAVSARLASSAYGALPITLVTMVAPATVALFAAGERLMRMGLAAISIVPSAMQSWVGSGSRREVRIARANRSIVLNALLGVVVGGAYGFLAPPISHVVFSGVATISSGLAWLFSIVILVICTSRATGGIGLVALSRIRVLAVSAIGGAVIGVPAILVLAAHFGPVGGVLGEIVAETVVLGVQFWGFTRKQSNKRWAQTKPSPSVPSSVL